MEHTCQFAYRLVLNEIPFMITMSQKKAKYSKKSLCTYDYHTNAKLLGTEMWK